MWIHGGDSSRMNLLHHAMKSTQVSSYAIVTLLLESGIRPYTRPIIDTIPTYVFHDFVWNGIGLHVDTPDITEKAPNEP